MTLELTLRAAVKDAVREVLLEMQGGKLEGGVNLLTLSEAAKRVHVSVTTIKRWIRAGLLPAMGTGRVRRVRVDALMAVLETPKRETTHEASVTSILAKVRR